ncbi:hypothetical protein M422DRAFT_251452 [Sphaerobolus stellatus SS14]|uniref:RRM domain-containing protein n=1 Tax=Sphaerobolus stellatus (strain SS14) TaxID=990650 RepID=A0A0C9W194_SPHS4|nr:hypothetical protein M422DRAFT_251452 [Sphaerobolus stellatus SS14]
MSSPNGKAISEHRSTRGESPRRKRSYSRDHSEKHRDRHDDRRRSRSRDRHRSDRHSRSRDRSRHHDRERERERGGGDRDRERDRDRDRRRGRERDERPRDRDRDRDRDDKDRRDRRRKREDEDVLPEDDRNKRKKEEVVSDVSGAPPSNGHIDDNVSVSRSDRRGRSHDSDPKLSDRHSSRRLSKEISPPPPSRRVDDRDRDRRRDRRGPPPRDFEGDRYTWTPGGKGNSPGHRPSPRYEVSGGDPDDEPMMEDEDSEARSVFVSQLAARLTARDLGYFFEDKLGEGCVKDARIVTDRLSKRSKGIGYVEFRSIDLVPRAIALSGTIVMGLPIMVQLTESERNKTHPGDNIPSGGGSSHGSMQIYVGSLHFNLTESDIRQVFEPFGELDFVDLHRDPLSGRSKGYCFIQYKRPEDARMALEQMEGFELAGRALRVKTVHEKGTARNLLNDSLDEGGGNLNAASRQALMQKLARVDHRDSKTPEPVRPSNIPQQQVSRCVLLRNMFNPDEETEKDWDKELAEDVKGECESQYGKVERIKVEKESVGEIYVRFDSIDAATKAIKSLNGRWFGGRQVSAHFISDAIMQAHQ